MAAATRNRFLEQLPPDELLGWEQDMRRSLLKSIESSQGSFPVMEWIDRRIGGEVETRCGPGGFQAYIRGSPVALAAAAGAAPAAAPVPQQQPPPPVAGPEPAGPGMVSCPKEKPGGPNSKETAFFSSLSPDSFAAPEEALREAIFEFLASWRSQDLATVSNLSSYAGVNRAKAAFLPKWVSLRDWIEYRIGGELEIRSGPRGAETIHLTEGAKTTVMAKYQQMTNSGTIGSGPPAPVNTSQPVNFAAAAGAVAPQVAVGPAAPQQMWRRGGGADEAPLGGGGADEAAAVAAGGDFFATLPGDVLLPAELALREALLDFVKSWDMNRPANRLPDTAPLFADASGATEIRKVRGDLLPPKVRLADWIERRIGGEIELRPIAGGQLEVHLRNGAAQGEDDRRSTEESRVAKEELKERFFAALPPEEFSAAEEAMREALLTFLDRRAGQRVPTSSDLAYDDELNRARQTLLPRRCPVSLKDWIDRRIGGEIVTQGSPTGLWTLALRSPDQGAPANKRARY